MPEVTGRGEPCLCRQATAESSAGRDVISQLYNLLQTLALSSPSLEPHALALIYSPYHNSNLWLRSSDFVNLIALTMCQARSIVPLAKFISFWQRVHLQNLSTFRSVLSRSFNPCSMTSSVTDSSSSWEYVRAVRKLLLAP